MSVKDAIGGYPPAGPPPGGKSTRDRWRRQRGGKRLQAVMLSAALVIILGGLVFGPLRGRADTTSNVSSLALQMDGNVSQQTTNPVTYDWANLFTPNCADSSVPSTGTSCPPGAAAITGVGPFFGTDFQSDWSVNADGTYNTFDSSTYATGTKDTLGIGNGGWQCNASNNVGNKVDITNFYVTAQIDPSNGHLIAYFGMEKYGSNGTNDIGVWFLSDKNADCNNPNTGKAINWSGHHADGDTLITSEFTSGGGTSSVEAFIWRCPNGTGVFTGADCDNNGSLQVGPKVNNVVTGVFNGSECGSANPGNVGLCAITNSSDLTHVPWLTASTAGVDHTVPTVQFYEGAADLTEIIGPNACVGRAVGDTRSSSVPSATLFDYASEPFAACGGLTVHKYIDSNLSGAFANGDPSGQGWTVSVAGPSPSTTVVCTGTTDSNGNLSTCTNAGGSLSNLQSGTYTITETQPSGWYNTDPGTGTTCNDTASGSTSPPDSTDVNKSSSVSCTVSVGLGGNTNVNLGNQCLVNVTFKVGSLPSGTTGVKAKWSVTSGPDAGITTTDVPLTFNSTNNDYEGTETTGLLQNDVVSWQFYINNNSSNLEPSTAITKTLTSAIASATNGTVLASAGACSATTTATFAASNIEAFKYKDKDADGIPSQPYTPDSNDAPINGFNFDLVALTSSSGISGSALTTAIGTACTAGTVPTSPCLAGTGTSATVNSQVGVVKFTGINPGYYQLHEDLTATPNWVKTGPTTDYVIQVKLGDTTDTTDTSGNTLNVLDTPQYQFGVTFSTSALIPPGNGTASGTSAADGTLSCTPNPASATTGQGYTNNGTGSSSYSSGSTTNATQTYTCTVVVTDP